MDRERQGIGDACANKQDSLPQQKSKLKNNTKKAISWRKNAKVVLFAIKASVVVANNAGVIF